MKIKRSLLEGDKKFKDIVYNYFYSKTNSSKKDVDYLLSSHMRHGTLFYVKGKSLCLLNIVDKTAEVNHLISYRCGVKGIRGIVKNIKEKYSFIDKLHYVREFKKNNKLRFNDIERYIK